MPKLKKLQFKHIRFLGAEGIGMSALVRILEGRALTDLKISKSDLSYKTNEPLDADIDLVVRSTAISEADPDYAELKKRGIEIWHRSDMLNYLSEGYRQIVVSGTHGKTTCTAMLAHSLKSLDPSFAVGGILTNYGTNGKAGTGEYFVLEGDESDKSFTKTSPYLALVTCVEPDHLENYPGGFAEIKSCFLKFLDSASHKVVCIDDPVLYDYWKAHEDCVSYSSKNPEADFFIDFSSEKPVIKRTGQALSLQLEMQGKHNYINACGVVAAANMLGLSLETAIQALKSFKGIKRRFELVNADYHGIKVYDDYAHHPSEIRALLEGALALHPKRLVFVYQPHHPERTKQFWDDFVKVFQDFPAQHLALIADVYVARSKNIPGIDSKRMVMEINRPNVKYLEPCATEVSTTVQGNYADIAAMLKPNIDKELKGCDYLFIVGAGNIAKVADRFILSKDEDVILRSKA